jgi:hypothetical protein
VKIKTKNLAKRSAIMCALHAMLFPIAAFGAELDGSSPLICSAFVASACDSDGTCITGTAESFYFPEFFRIDFDNQSVQSILPSGETRETIIQNLHSEDGVMFLQGNETDRAWSAALSEEDGKFSIAAAGTRVSFSIFGACIVP